MLQLHVVARARCFSHKEESLIVITIVVHQTRIVVTICCEQLAKEIIDNVILSSIDYSLKVECQQ